MKGKTELGRVLMVINHWCVFFLLAAFVVTCCMMLFVTVLSRTLDVSLTEENISSAAKLTFANVLLISLIFSTVDAVRRRLTVEKPLGRVIDAAEKIMQGDFSVRIPKQSTIASDDAFNRVIDCFNRMAAELGSVETLRTDFIANVSHELKTPLAVIQNYGVMLSAESLPDCRRVEYAKGITDNSRRLADLITNILRLNRLENQQIFPKAESFDLSEQLCSCILQFEDVWERKEIDISTDIPDSVYIMSDAELLMPVWNNLLSNAFKFTECRGRVTVSLTADESSAVVKISDTGCGFGMETGQHIFEKFYQGDTSHSSQGNGLGLALVKRVIDIIHGEISVESELGRGSSFTVRLKRGEGIESEQ